MGRRKSHLEHRCDVALGVSEQYWVARNMLVLELALQVNAGSQLYFMAEGIVLPGAALRHEVAAHGAVFESELHRVARGNPVIRPALNRTPHAADRIADQVVVGCV